LPALVMSSSARSDDFDASFASQIRDVMQLVSSQYFMPISVKQLIAGCARELSLVGTVHSNASPEEISDLRDLLKDLRAANPALFNDAKMRDLCLHGMLGSLDEQSAYLDEAGFDKLRKDTVSSATSSVRSEQIEGRYLYVKVAQFQEKTVEELAGALELARDLAASPAAIILDLRNSPGGILTSTIGVAAAFLPHGATVLLTKGRMADANQTMFASPDYYALRLGSDPFRLLPPKVKQLPMAVLVNNKTNSGAEAVAGALQDNRRAIVIGEQTPGIGKIQTFRMIDAKTAIKLTTARMFSPNGRGLDANGITPDISANSDAALAAALEHFRKSIPY